MADQKLTALPAVTDVADTDVVYVVDGVGGTPASKRIAGADLKAAMVADHEAAADPHSGVYAPDRALRAALGLDTVLAYDTFNRADGAIGTADSGQPWTLLAGTLAISSNQAVRTFGLPATAALTGLAGNGRVSATVTPGASNTTPGLVFRALDGDNHLYVAVSSALLLIAKRVAGVNTALTSAALPTTATEPYRIDVWFAGDLIRAHCRGATVAHTLSAGDFTEFSTSRTTVGVTTGAAGSVNLVQIDDFYAAKA